MISKFLIAWHSNLATLYLIFSLATQTLRLTLEVNELFTNPVDFVYRPLAQEIGPSLLCLELVEKQENGEIVSALLWRLESRINVTSFNEWEYFFSLVYIDLFLFTAWVYWRKKMELCSSMLSQNTVRVCCYLPLLVDVDWCSILFNSPHPLR